MVRTWLFFCICYLWCGRLSWWCELKDKNWRGQLVATEGETLKLLAAVFFLEIRFFMEANLSPSIQ